MNQIYYKGYPIEDIRSFTGTSLLYPRIEPWLLKWIDREAPNKYEDVILQQTMGRYHIYAKGAPVAHLVPIKWDDLTTGVGVKQRIVFK